MATDLWSTLSRPELIALGKRAVSERLQALGCAVTEARNPMDGKLEVRAASGRLLEVFVSTQRPGGYAFWTKRRLRPASDRFAAVFVLEEPAPDLYLVPTNEWLNASAPLTDRDYEGKQSEPEYGIDLSSASLQRYRWDDRVANQFR